MNKQSDTRQLIIIKYIFLGLKITCSTECFREFLTTPLRRIFFTTFVLNYKKKKKEKNYFTLKQSDSEQYVNNISLQIMIQFSARVFSGSSSSYTNTGIYYTNLITFNSDIKQRVNGPRQSVMSLSNFWQSIFCIERRHEITRILHLILP